MKNGLAIFTITLMLLFCYIKSQAQSDKSTPQPNQNGAGFPSMKDWFLSTGYWDRDPQIYVREVGTGSDTLIMLHGGWGGDYEGMVESITGLENDYHFVFYDQRGSLRSPFPDSLISFDGHVADLEALRQELGLSKVTVVAHSMGAVLACAYASKYPQRIKRLILLAPAPLKNPIPNQDLSESGQQEMVQAFLQRGEVVQELDKYNLRRESPALSSKEETARFRISFGARMLYDVSKWPLLAGGRTLYKGHVFQLTAQTYPGEGWDYYAEFQKQQYPVRIISGDHDFLDFGNHLNKKWGAGIANVKLTTIRSAGHVIWLDQPTEFRKELTRNLKN